VNTRKTLTPLLAALALAVVSGCSMNSPRSAAQADCCREGDVPALAKPSAPLSDRSLYQLESVWTNDAAKPLRLAELRGRPQIVVMFFASCQYACPVLVHDLKRIAAALPKQLRSNVGLVLVSFDTERDTPPALAAYRERQELPRDRWTLLHGRPDDVLELAALLGVKYKQDARGQFSHSNIITVLNAEGEVVHQQIGLNQSIDETVSAVQRLASR
jgi:protein SCO1/2